MKVSELIEKLSSLDPNLPVVFVDYQNGTQLVDGVKEIEEQSWDSHKENVAMLLSDTGAF